ncbi:MAG: hypothetical protein HYV09_25220 [Deltaproteobacteria bacterium]|nr:hypothetical protein [Deltaproteobacteria bacterium]
MRRALVLSLLSIGCGGAAPAPTTQPTAKASKPATCAPGSDSAPRDARARMGSLQAEIRKCYTLATGGGDADVKVEVTIGASGEVTDAKVIGGGGQKGARSCFEKTLRGAKFAGFCGPNVSIRWTYALR